MRDDQTTVAELRALVQQFVSARQWEQFHNPKNLAMSLAIEAGELMEHFQWRSPTESAEIAGQPELRTEVAHEMADVACYLLALANVLEIDLASAVEAKMRLNEAKYPAAASRGRWQPPGDPERR